MLAFPLNRCSSGFFGEHSFWKETSNSEIFPNTVIWSSWQLWLTLDFCSNNTPHLDSFCWEASLFSPLRSGSFQETCLCTVECGSWWTSIMTYLTDGNAVLAETFSPFSIIRVAYATPHGWTFPTRSSHTYPIPEDLPDRPYKYHWAFETPSFGLRYMCLGKRVGIP